MTPAEAQAQMTMWAIVAAPLILGSDPRTLSPATIAMLENPRVIAVDQDRLAVQGTRSPARATARCGSSRSPTPARGRAAQPWLDAADDRHHPRRRRLARRPLLARELWTGGQTSTTGGSARSSRPPAVLYRAQSE